MINYDTVHNEAVYRYIYKVFYGRINKMKYESQILNHNIWYINVNTIQNIIQMVKLLDGSDQKNNLLLTCLI